MAFGERTAEERRRAAALDAEFKPFYKRRSFWLLLLLGLVLGAGFAVAIPFVAPALVMGLITTLIALTSPVAGWAIMAIVGAVVGLALMAATYALVRGIGNKIKQYRKEQQAKEAETNHRVEGSEAANEIAAKIAELIKEDTPESRQQESALRQKALTMDCANAAQKAGFHYAALGVKCTVGESKEFNESDYSSAFRKLRLRWHPDRNRTVENAEAEFKTIGETVEQLKNPQSDLWKYAGSSEEERTRNQEVAQQLDTLKNEVREHREDTARLAEECNETRNIVQRYIRESDEIAAGVQEVKKECYNTMHIAKDAQRTVTELKKDTEQMGAQINELLDKFGIIVPPQLANNGSSSSSATSNKVIHRGPAGGSSENHTAAPPSVPSITSDEEDIIVEETEHRSSFRFDGKPIGE